MFVWLSLSATLTLTLVSPWSSSAAAAAAAAAPVAPAEVAKKGEPFGDEIKAFEAADRTNPPPVGAVLFIGSSSIRLWQTLSQDFPDHRVINRGFGGSQIIDSVNYFERIVRPCRPRLVVLYAGGNDINAKKTPEQVFQDFQRFAQKVTSQLPGTKLAYISIAPNPARWAQIEQVRAANKMIEGFIKTRPDMRYIDTHSQMLGADGQPKPDIYVNDRLHMNPEGYKIWTRVVSPYLAQWPSTSTAAPASAPAERQR
jgi:lysophospholipase L1-like esterase